MNMTKEEVIKLLFDLESNILGGDSLRALILIDDATRKLGVVR